MENGFILGKYTGLFIGKQNNNPPIEKGWVLAEVGKSNYSGIWMDDESWKDDYVWYD